VVQTQVQHYLRRVPEGRGSLGHLPRRVCRRPGGILFSAKLPGFVIGHFGSYVQMFAIMGSLHPIALVVMSQLSWRKRRQAAAPV